MNIPRPNAENILYGVAGANLAIGTVLTLHMATLGGEEQTSGLGESPSYLVLAGEDMSRENASIFNSLDTTGEAVSAGPADWEKTTANGAFVLALVAGGAGWTLEDSRRSRELLAAFTKPVV